MRGEKSSLSVILFGMFLTISAHAADKTKSTTIDCSKDSLEAELNKLDRSIPNAVEVTGECTGLVTIEGHRDLTLVGIAPASISGVYVPEDSAGSTTALDIFDSRVTLQDITINGGNYGLFCSDKSTCILRDVTVQGGHVGVGVQSQSAVDILGSSQIINSENWGVGVFGASSVNMRPNWDSGFDPFEAGPVVSGHCVGIWVQDRSFFRSDNVTVSGNGVGDDCLFPGGVQAQRDALIKMFVAYDFFNDQWAVPGAGVTGNLGYGFQIHRNSTAQIGLPVTNNGGSGIRLGSLSFLQNAGLFFDQNGGGNVSCEHLTAVSNFCPDLGQTISGLQEQIDALDGRVAQNESDVATNSAEIGSNRTSIEASEVLIGQNSADIGVNRNSIEASEVLIGQNSADIGVNRTSIEASEVLIGQNSAEIGVNRTSIEASEVLISDLQAQIAALEEAANETLEQKVAGKIFAVRSTGHGSGGSNNAPQPTPPLWLDNPQRDFSVADGTLILGEDGSFNLQLLLTIIPMNVTGFYQEINDIPLGNSGTWEVDVSTNEIVLSAIVDGEVVGEQRLQSTPSGEVLTVVSNDQRLVKGDPSIGGFFNTFYADAVYIQLPNSE